MKTLQDYINEGLVGESMSHKDVVALEDVIKRFIDAGGKDKLAPKLFDGDDMKPEVSKILDTFDEYAEDVLQMINSLLEDNKQRQALFEEIL